MPEKKLSFEIEINGLSNEATEMQKLSVWMKNLKEDIAKLNKEIKEQGGVGSKEQLQKLAAMNVALKDHANQYKDLSRVVNTANDSLARKRTQLIQLKQEYSNSSQEVAQKMVPAIKKLNDEILASERAIGVHSRNVGNYPDLTNAAAGGFQNLTSAVGGSTEMIGTAVSGFATAGGAAGMVTVAIGTLAAAWKRVQENVELYLASADKLRYGFAGYERDASKAQIEARRRANGQVTVGRASLTEANRILDYAGSTAEQKEEARLMAEQAKMMIAEGKAFRDQVVGIKDKITWTLKYNQLLQDAEDIDDRRKDKAIEWKRLDAEFIEQRKIATDQASTTLQIQQATARAEEIAKQLLAEKSGLIDEQIKNIETISKLTFTEEETEDQIRALKEEKNELLAQYESAGIRINRMERTAAKDGKAELEEEKKNLEEILKLRKDVVTATDEVAKIAEKLKKNAYDNFSDLADTNANPNQISKGIQKILGISDKDLGLQKMNPDQVKTTQVTSKDQDKQEIADIKSKEDMILAIKNGALQAAEDGANAVFQSKKSRLQAEMTAELAKENMTEQQKSAIKKKYAKEQQKMDITQALINGALAVGRAAINSWPVPAIPMMALAGIATAIQVGVIKAQKYATGGRITGGYPIETGTPDNLLIAVNNKEAVVNERQIARLGGSAAMRRAGVPGYATGGYVGGTAPYIPASPESRILEALEKRLVPIEVTLDINKVNSAQRELARIVNDIRPI